MKKNSGTAPETAGPKMDRHSDLLRKTVRHLRQRMRLSQAELAKLAGITQGLLSKFESGKQDLSAEAQERVWAALEQARLYGKADAQNNWGMSDFPMVGFAMKLITGASPQPASVSSVPPMSKKMLKEQENLLREADKLVDDAIAKLSPGQIKQLIENDRIMRAQIERQNQQFSELTNAGFAILPESIAKENEELKAKVAKLEGEIRKLKEDKSNG